jgi:hypothetical protein
LEHETDHTIQVIDLRFERGPFLYSVTKCHKPSPVTDTDEFNEVALRRIICDRGDQLDQLREPYFRRQQSARAMYSTLKFITSKYLSVLTDEHITGLYLATLRSWPLTENSINQMK